MSGLLGFIGQGLSSVFENSFMEEDRNQRQMFSSGQDQINREFQERMSNTQYYRTMQDLNNAGLNPMLALMKGPNSSPSGGVSGASGGTGPRVDLGAGMATAVQIERMEAETANIKAQEERAKAETKEIQARTPTHAVSIDQMRQNISESVERVGRILAEVNRIRQDERTSAASEFNLQQQTRNLVEQVPQIRETVRLLKEQQSLTKAQTGQTSAHETEMRQRIAANLPRLEGLLRDLEAQAKILEMPRRNQESVAHDGFIGTFGAIIRMLSPLSGLLNSTK